MKDSKFQALLPVFAVFALIAISLAPVGLIATAFSETQDAETLAENSDLNDDGRVDLEDLRLLFWAWHGTVLPSATPVGSSPTPTLTPVASLDGFWVGDMTEYFSDVPGDALHRKGQFLWYVKTSGTKLTATGDDRQYPLTVTADIEGDLITGTIKSFTNFDMWAVASFPDSSTSSDPEIEGWFWGSDDGFDYNGEFLLKKTNSRPTLVPTATYTPTPIQTTTQGTPTVTPTSTFIF